MNVRFFIITLQEVGLHQEVRFLTSEKSIYDESS